MAWATAGVLGSPAAGTILADSGTLTASMFSFTIIIVTQYAARVAIVLRDATNTTDVMTQLFKTQSDEPTAISEFNFLVGLNQRLVLRAESDMIGEVQASLLW